jgi:hypothetical protein
MRPQQRQPLVNHTGSNRQIVSPSERRMNSISIFCPVTGGNVDSGVETDWSTFFQLRPFRMRVRCPQCGGRHEVSVREGYLARTDALDGGRSEENPRLESLMTRLGSR